MKKFFLLSITLFLLCACTPSAGIIQTAVAETLAVNVFVKTLNAKPTLPSTYTPVGTSSDEIKSTPSPNVALSPDRLPATVNVNFTYLYAGPSPYHKMIMCSDKICSFPKGTQVYILEKNNHSNEIWYFISTTNGETGWLYSGWLTIDGDPNILPTASYVPTYPRLPTSAPTNSEPNPNHPNPVPTVPHYP